MKMLLNLRRTVAPDRRCGSREICAHLELAAGGRTAFRTEPEPWARSGPGFFDALPLPPGRTQEPTSRAARPPDEASDEARGSFFLRNPPPTRHDPGATK